MNRVDEGTAIGKLLFMSGGLWVWALHFTVLYAFTTVACAAAFSAVDIFGIRIVPFAIGVATLLAWAVVVTLLWIAVSGPVPPRSARFSEATEQFFRYAAAVTAILSLVAIAWTALPTLLFKPC